MMGSVTAGRNRVAEAERRARRILASILDDIHERRLAEGLSQADVATALHCSRSWVGALERNEVSDVGFVELSRIGAAVGLDISARTHEGSSLLRDAGQVRLLNRLRSQCHASLPWGLEVAVGRGDPRAFDAVIGLLPKAAAVEAITHLRDVQAQVRRAQLKAEAAGVEVILLLLSDTENNRRAVREAGRQLLDAFPLTSRAVLAYLRRGEVPPQSGIVFL